MHRFKSKILYILDIIKLLTKPTKYIPINKNMRGCDNDVESK